MSHLPVIRTSDIVTQELKDELLVYDLTIDKAFCLNETSAKVFNACDGTTTFAELRARGELTDEIVHLALEGLKENNLLASYYVSPLAEMSRREVIKRIGLASVIALPVISAIVAPTAAMAASGSGGGFCAPIGECIAYQMPICPPGCNSIVEFNVYASSYDGTCSGPSLVSVTDCAVASGGTAASDVSRRIS